MSFLRALWVSNILWLQVTLFSRLTKTTAALSPSDQIALATLILSIPSTIATIFGAIINYRRLKQSQTSCKLCFCTTIIYNGTQVMLTDFIAHKSTLLPIHELQVRNSYPRRMGLDSRAMSFASTTSATNIILRAAYLGPKQIIKGFV